MDRSRADVVSTAHARDQSLGKDGNDAIAAAFQSPCSVATDTAGHLYIADCITNTIHKVTPDRQVCRFAGVAFDACSTDGPGTQAKFSGPVFITIDFEDNLYVADSRNSTVRKITPTGVVSTFAGVAGRIGSTDGNGAAARFFLPIGLATDSAHNLYVADAGNHNIRKITR